MATGTVSPSLISYGNLFGGQNSHRPRRKSKREFAIVSVDVRFDGHDWSLGDSVCGLGIIVSDNCQLRLGQARDRHANVLDFAAVVGQLDKVGVLGAGCNPVNRPKGRITSDFFDCVAAVDGEHLLDVVAASLDNSVGALSEWDQVGL